jgi:hypothetical protein
MRCIGAKINEEWRSDYAARAAELRAFLKFGDV